MQLGRIGQRFVNVGVVACSCQSILGLLDFLQFPSVISLELQNEGHMTSDV